MHADIQQFQPVEPFTVFHAGALKVALLRQLDSHPDALVLDMSAVDEIDTAGVQLLLMLKREARLRSCRLTFRAINPAVREVLDLLALSSHFHSGPAGAAGTPGGA